ncbi:hypothetical protein OIU84_016195 [Salix udensis]|uniref:DYW domain-containing protein n=1 Tax=Salix udensis TaxID=889485 RepID=A0AAD6NQ38_9ROSI|nr:hypothetical protein OIU84_016195 [Salix udensis]
MDKLAPFHHSPPLFQNHKPKPIRTLSSPSLSLALTTTSSIETAVTPTRLPNLGSLNGFTADSKTLDSVKAMHAQIIKKGNDWNSDSMAKHLITSYLDLGDYKAAAMVFFVGFARNYVMWNNFLEEFKSFGGDPSEVLEVFKELRCEGVVFDSRVISVVLKICASVMNLWLGLEVHASLIKRGFELDVYVKCALMSFYGRCWRVESANQVFHESPNLDDLLWNEAILVNLKNERFVKALELFREMQFLSSKVNATAVLKILQACSKEGALNEGKQIHGYVLKLAMESNLSICNSLIIMYSRNGKIKIASRVFDSMKDHSLSSWNSIISSYTTLGYLDDAWNLLCKMERSGTKPDIVTWNSILSGNAIARSYKEVLVTLLRMQAAGFRPNPRSITSVLQAVNELGLLNFGKEIHGYVIRNGLDYDAYVGTSLLDMYVKNDCLTSSQAFFDNMKNKNIVAWNSLISGYSFKGHFDDAKRLLNRMKVEGIKPDLITLNSLVAGGIKPRQVWSWIQIDQRVNLFSTGGIPHQDEGEIYYELYQLVSDLKNYGYLPDLNCVYQNIDEVEKEKMLLSHTEKLAITYGLIKTSSAPIRVIKNTRICSDCHTAAKFISLVRCREIFLRDGVRFHHFKAGKCSCNDYW